MNSSAKKEKDTKTHSVKSKKHVLVQEKKSETEDSSEDSESSSSEEEQPKKKKKKTETNESKLEKLRPKKDELVPVDEELVISRNHFELMMELIRSVDLWLYLLYVKYVKCDQWKIYNHSKKQVPVTVKNLFENDITI